MNETNISWLRDGEVASISTNDPRLIEQLEALARKDPTAARMVHRYRGTGSGEDWTVGKECINIVGD